MARMISLHKTTMRGLRASNEDVEKYVLNLDNSGYPKNNNYAPIDLCIICDGHGGDMVSKYVAPRLEHLLMNPKIIYPLSYDNICNIFTHIQNEIKQNPSKIGSYCGCTALVVIRYLDKFGKENIQVINIGDCRAIMSKNGLVRTLTKDHKPFWPDEEKRIDEVNRKNPHNVKKIHHEAGDWRIGDLSVSRAFGDLDNTPHVTHIPDVYNYKLGLEHEFIIMACDGLWDSVQENEAINFVRNHRYHGNTDYYNIRYELNGVEMIYPSEEVKNTNNIARKLASYAIAKGSKDNVSILIMFFDKK